MGLGDDGLAVTFYSIAEGLNVIVTDGCIGITSITADEVVIQFNLDSVWDDNNFLKGTNTLEFCQ